MSRFLFNSMRTHKVLAALLLLVVALALPFSANAGKKKKKSACTFEGCCVTQIVWDEATTRLNDFFATLTLKTLCEKGQAMGLKREQDHRFMYYI